MDVQDEDIIVEHLKEAGSGHRFVQTLNISTLFMRSYAAHPIGR